MNEGMIGYEEEYSEESKSSQILENEDY